MKWLKRIASSLVVCGLLVLVLGPSMLRALKSTAFAQALIAQWKIKGVFEKHGHQVVWERIDGATSPSPLHTLAIEHIEKRGGWKIPTRDYSSQTRENILPTTLIHVKEVHGIASHGETVFFFLFEFLVPAEAAQRRVPSLNDPFKTFPDHRHGSFFYYYLGKAVAWGDLSAFPLERYFPFEEIRGRQSWVEETHKRLLFWGWGIGGMCLLSGLGVLVWFYFPVTVAWVATGLGEIFLRWRPAYSMPGIPLGTAGRRKKNSGENVPDQDSVPHPGAKDALAREKMLFICCLLYLRERELEEARTAAKAQRDALYQQVAGFCSEAVGDKQDRITELLKQFPRGSSRADIRKAQVLLREVRMISAEGEALASVFSAPAKSVANTASEEGSDFQKKALAATDAEALATRWIYGFLEDIDPYIKEKGGDPLIAKTIILWGFLRPKRQDSFVAGNYGRTRNIRENLKRKRGEVERVFGRRLLLEEIGENFALLKKGKVIIENDTHPGMAVCSLNDDEKAVAHPWCEVIRIINRARRELLSLRSGGRP